MDIRDRARGALLGMGIGEALGAPLEGLEREQIEQKVGRISGFLDARRTQPDHRSGFFVRETYEDETQIALATVETLIRTGGFQVEALRACFEELGQFVEGNVFGCYRRPRRNFRTAVRRMLAGGPWEACGVNTAGAGAASRGIPIGVWHRSDAEGRLRSSVEATLLTHRDPRSAAATGSVAAVAALVACAQSPGSLEPADVARAAAAGARDAEDLMENEYADVLYPGYEPYLHQYSEACAALEGLVRLDIEPAFQAIVKGASGKGSRPITRATRGFSLTAVISSLYLFLTGLESYEESLLDTICEGGSTDTLGCLVGGLSGALHGEDGIPMEWRETLKGSGHLLLWGDLLAGGVDRARAGSLIEEEAHLTPSAPPPPRKKPRPVEGGGDRDPRDPRDRRPGARRRGGAPRNRGRGGSVA